MASGGGGPLRPPASEPKGRSLLYRLTNSVDEDRSSTGSGRLDDRPNNWDFSDWRPSSTFDPIRRTRDKRTNSEKELENQVEREKGTSLSQDSTPRAEKKIRTPATFPRTKITPVTTAAQMSSIENLKQYLSFSDAEERSGDGEKNNERLVGRHHAASLNSVDCVEMNGPVRLGGSVPDRSELLNDVGSMDSGGANSLRNTNFSKEEDMPDSNQVVGRLMQIRDYIKQASSMMEKLQMSTDAGEQNRAAQLQQVVGRLKEQENKYLDLLLKVSKNKEDIPNTNQNELNNSRPQSASDVGFGELEMESDSSEATVDVNDDTRPRIEDKLGHHSDTDNALNSTQSSQSHTESSHQENSDLERTLVLERDQEVSSRAAQLAARQGQLESDLLQKNEELEALRQQHDLLQKMLKQQEQLKALQNRQATLLALQREAESRLEQERAQQAQHLAQASTQPAPSSGTTGESTTEQSESDTVEQLDGATNLDAGSVNTDSDASLVSLERRHLQDKLQDLQDKKRHMDKLLSELQSLQGGATLLNNERGAASSSGQQHVEESMIASSTASQTAGDALGVLNMLETRKKLRKLKEVKERLNQLRDLVQYYETGNEFIHKQEGEPPTMVSMNDFNDPQVIENLREMQGSGVVQQRLDQYARGADHRRDHTDYEQYGRGEDQPRREQPRLDQYSHPDDGLRTQPHQRGGEGGMYKQANRPQVVEIQDDTGSESESQLSSLGVWGEDPEIQEKVRKLKAAKEKLKKLQELVSMVQQAPDSTGHLPHDLALLAASLQAEGYTPSEGEVNAALPDENNYYSRTMREQQQELEQLMEERQKLVIIQDQLQRLHDQLPQGTRNMQVQTSHDSLVEQEGALVKQQLAEDEADEAPEPSVTFQEPIATVASNDEIYGRMRQQRILREELREKKKELEDMMRKDRPHKQYSRNRDIQSDNVSLSNKSDQFGTSVVSGDVTMATWGGSTVDNLESIEEENTSGQVQQMDQDVDDGYPSDGIVQVEEEEEADNAESDDADTYTVEEEYRKGRQGKVKRPVIDGLPRSSRRRKRAARGAPLMEQPEGQRNYSMWSPDGPSRRLRNKKGQWTNKTSRSHRCRERQYVEDMQDSETSELREQVHSLQLQMENTKALCQSLMHQRPPWQPQVSAGFSNQLMSPATVFSDPNQVQVMQGLSQCYQQLASQQQAMSTMGQYLQQIAARLGPAASDAGAGDTFGLPENLATSTSQGDAPLGASASNPFSFSPRFPDTFAFPNNPASYGVSGGLSLSSNLQAASKTATTRRGQNQPTGPLTSMSDTQAILNNQRQLSQSQLNTSNIHRSSLLMREDSPSSLPGSLRDGRGRLSDDVPIQDVMASDVDRLNLEPDVSSQIPRLNLVHLQSRERGKDESGNFSNRLADVGVIGEKFPTPQRAQAGASLASQRVKDNSFQAGPLGAVRPGLSAGISGAGFQDGGSISSVVSSTKGGSTSSQQKTRRNRKVARGVNTKPEEASDATDMSVFEAMRETIYSEVATLISQNEDRPHFLIELFRELQMLNSDYLRQRTLYAIQELVSKTLTEDSIHEQAKAQRMAWTRGTANTSELTPSESMATSEDEDEKAQGGPSLTSSAVKPLHSNSAGLDYAEAVEDTSTQSTPGSDSYWDNPFAQDSLGDTVIHFEEALQRMREQERGDEEGEVKSPAGTGSTPPTVRRASGFDEVKQLYNISNTPAQDQVSDGSASDAPYPRINTQKLDAQIKGIMKEVIPAVREHLDEVCSQQLVQYLRRLVLALTRQKDESHEFARFFHKQLGSILQDSLSKFEGRKLRDCGEDLIVDVSEILFNELAFFRLMQDLNDAKHRKRGGGFEEWRQDSEVSATDMTDESYEPGTRQDQQEESSEESSESESAPQSQSELETQENQAPTSEAQAINKEEEDLGKARDDELAARVETSDRDEQEYDSDSEKRPVQIELAVSETKPYTRIGSDEDDDLEDEEEDMPDTDTAVSRSLTEVEKGDEGKERESASPAEDGGEAPCPPDQAGIVIVGCGSAQDVVANGDVTANTEKTGETVEETASEAKPTPPVNGALEKPNDCETVTLDDLPTKLTSLTKEELESKMTEERESTESGAQVVLSVVEAALEGEELAGDPAALREPVTECSDGTRKV